MKKIVLSFFTLGALAFGADNADQLVTHTELGYIQTQGNTETETFNLDANAKKGWGKHIFSLALDAQYATEKRIETKHKYITELQYSYDLTVKIAFGYLFGYKKDFFSGYDYQLYTGPTVKYSAIKSKTQNLSFELGALYAQDNIEDIHYDSTGAVIAYPNPNNIQTASVTYGKIENYGSYRLKGVYNKQLLDNLKFAQELTYRASVKNDRNYFATSKTAFTSKLSDIFSAGITYKVDYMNLPSSDKEYSDRTFTANLIVDY